MLNNLLSFFVKDTYCYGALIDSIPISLLLYSHIPTALVALCVGIFLFVMNRKKLDVRIFFFLSITFFLFTLGDLIEWFVFLGSGPIMFSRSVIELLDPLLFILAGYFLYVLIKKKDAPFTYKVIWFLLWLPEFIIVFLGYNLTGYNWTICEAVENPVLTSYVFYLDLFYLVFIIIFSIKEVIKSISSARKRILISSLGVCFFVILFFITEYVLTGYILGLSFDYVYFVYAFFGMPVLIAFLAYLTIEFKIFNTKLITPQILVFGTLALIFSQSFFLSSKISFILNIITILLTAILGGLIIKNVKREISQREKIEKLAWELKKANDKLRELDQLKSEFLSFASHQLRSPLTAINGYVSMLLEGTFGSISDQVKNSIEIIGTSSESLIKIVNEFLDISRIEQGGMKYTFSDFDFKELAFEVFNELHPNAEKKGFALYEFSNSDDKDFIVNGDVGKIKQIVGNLLDNSIKYTPKGGVKVRVERKNGKITVSVKDTGIGISKETLPKLFAKFSRAKNASKTNVGGTGLGLYVAKKMMEAHNGQIWVESDGEGKGSSFFVELNAKNV